MIVTVSPAPNRPGYFRALVEGRYLCTSRQPFLDSARVLLSEGFDPQTLLSMRHEGGKSLDGLTCTLQEASKWRVEEGQTDGPRFVKWKPFPGGLR